MSSDTTPEERNPYAPSADWKPGQDTFTSQAAGIWAEGFAAGRAAFDAVVAERDRAIEQREQAATSRNVIAQQRDLAIDRLDAVSRERDAASEVLALIYVMLTGAEPMWAEMPFDERCARAANEAQQAFLAVSGSSEPRKETT